MLARSHPDSLHPGRPLDSPAQIIESANFWDRGPWATIEQQTSRTIIIPVSLRSLINYYRNRPDVMLTHCFRHCLRCVAQDAANRIEQISSLIFMNILRISFSPTNRTLRMANRRVKPVIAIERNLGSDAQTSISDGHQNTLRSSAPSGRERSAEKLLWWRCLSGHKALVAEHG